MAFIMASLERVGGGKRGKQIWHYHSDDALATIAASGYFNTAVDMLGKGDVIFAIGDMDATETVDLLIVSSETAASPVVTTNGTA